jgi:uncharacterized protein
LLPPDGAAYPHVLRGAGYAWWRSTLGIVLALLSLLLLPALVSRAVTALGWATTGANQDFDDYARRADAFELPSGLLAANLGVAVLAVVSWLLIAGLHRMRPRWLSSVQPGLRWRYLLRALAVAAIVLVGVQLLSLLVTSTPDWALQPSFWGFLVVILLTSPLQALAEELFFRGYLLQALGSLVAQPWFGAVASAVVFAGFHGAQNPALFVDRLILGLVAGVLVWRTGGLEAAIAAHVVGNVATYVLAALTTSVATVRAVEEMTWSEAAFDIVGFAVFAGIAVLVAARMGLRRRVDLRRDT